MSVPPFRIWLCGTFRVERHTGTVYESMRTVDWGGSSYPRLLLKALLCRPGRQARREALMELLWPDCEPEQAVQNLNTATTKLRSVLRPAKGQESLLLTENDATMYRLPGQEQLWVDVDAALTLLNEAERLDRTSAQTLSLLEEAERYFSQGPFQQDEEGQWVTGRRATVEQARYHCRLWLAEAYEQQSMPGQAATTLSLLLEEDPFDEDVLCRLMALLHRQGMTHQALRFYENACEAFVKEGLELTETTRTLAAQLRQEFSPISSIAARPMQNSPHKLSREAIDGTQHVLALPTLLSLPENLLTDHSGSLAEMSFSLSSFLRADSDILAHVSHVLSNPFIIEEKEITLFDQQTRLYWKIREDTTIPATTLYNHVIRHPDDLTSLLARSHLPVMRSYLCEVVCRTILLAGILLYDTGQYAKARHYYQVAFQAATEANNPVLQAIVWGWMSFTWTYTKRYNEALHCVQHARHFAGQTTNATAQAWLGAVESEIQAHLCNHHACLQALRDMERGNGVSLSPENSYLFEFNPVLLLGYKGVCFQQLYQHQNPATHSLLKEAKEALEQALASEAPLKRKLYYLSDLAGVYARQGEVEAACTYLAQSIPLIMQVGSGSKTIRKHLVQMRVLLRSHEYLSAVQTLDEQIAPLFLEMQGEEL